MTIRVPRRSRYRDTIALAGWLFADLLLGLAMLFFVFNTVGVRPTPTPGPTPTPYPTYTPGPTPTPYPTFTPGPTFTPYPTYTPGPTYTPYPTYTPGPTPTPYPTYTPGPTPTPYPTYTPGPTPTPYPTYTPGPSPTPYPTYTPGPTPTPYPTYTPWPTPRPLPTHTPLPRTGLDARSSTITLVTNADALLSPAGEEKARAVEQVRAQIRERLAALRSRRAGIVLTFGVSPDPFEGNRIAREVNRVLVEAFPEIFEGAILRDYHTIDPNRANRGNVELEIYFLIETPR